MSGFGTGSMAEEDRREVFAVFMLKEALNYQAVCFGSVKPSCPRYSCDKTQLGKK